MSATKYKQENIKVQPGTKAKYRRVKKATRLSFASIADLAIDCYIAQTKNNQSNTATAQ